MALNVNTSIVDYLTSVGQASDYGSRSKLASTYGIQNYQGTANQNIQLLNLLKGGSQPATQSNNTPTVTPSASVSTPSTTATPRLDYVNSFIDEYKATNTANQAKVDESRQKLIDYYAGLTPITDRYTKLSTEQGLPQQQELVNSLTKNVMNTEDLIDKVEPSVTARSGDFLMTEADRTALVSREQKPLLTELNKLLRNKQYEEIGLAGKQNLVKELIAYSIQQDQMGAKPFELGVDFTEADRKAATDVFDKILSTSVSAFNADVSSSEAKAESAADREFQLTKMEKQLANDLALESAKQKTGTSTKTNTKTESAWTDIIKGSSTEYDVWQKINDNQTALRAMGVDVDDLWRRHKALADQVGTGGKIKGDSTIDYTSDTSSYYP